jgi:hypothetical protein
MIARRNGMPVTVSARSIGAARPGGRVTVA